MAEERLGRYLLQEILGEGAMGMVYRAHDPLLERDVAIKTIRLEITRAERDDFEQRFLREAKSAGKLSHPGIVTVYDAGEVSNIAYIAMEYLQGQDLRELIRNEQRLAPDQIADIAAQIADALEYAHQHGVIHRDVKPGNIMVLPDGKVKLMDFGIARMQTSGMTQTGMMLGTPKYMSPELIVGAETDGRTDIYSLGVVLYQMLTGSAPFESNTISTTLYRIMHDPAPHPSTLGIRVSPGFEHILNRALAKKPEKRYAHAAEMATDLRHIKALDQAHKKIKFIGLGRPVKLRNKHKNLSDQTASENPPHQPAQPAAMMPRKIRFSIPPKFALWFVMVLMGGLFWHYLDRTSLPKNSPENFINAGKNQSSNTQAKARPPLPRIDSIPRKNSVSAQLSLAVTPWGEVFVDGQLAGITPPLTKIPLSVGQHQIEIRNGNAPVFSQTIRIASGENQTIHHKF